MTNKISKGFTVLLLIILLGVIAGISYIVSTSDTTPDTTNAAVCVQGDHVRISCGGGDCPSYQRYTKTCFCIGDSCGWHYDCEGDYECETGNPGSSSQSSQVCTPDDWGGCGSCSGCGHSSNECVSHCLADGSGWECLWAGSCIPGQQSSSQSQQSSAQSAQSSSSQTASYAASSSTTSLGFSWLAGGVEVVDEIGCAIGGWVRDSGQSLTLNVQRADQTIYSQSVALPEGESNPFYLFLYGYVTDSPVNLSVEANNGTETLLLPVNDDGKTVIEGFKCMEVPCGPIDVNQDGKLNIVDLSAFSRIYGQSCVYTEVPGCGSKDRNQDGKLDIVDLSYFARYYGGSCPR